MSLMRASENRVLPEVPGVTHQFVDIPGARLHVAEAGAGEPVILLHGFPQHWYAWRHVIPLLADEYRLICPDFRGFGWSAATRPGYGTQDRIADILALMDALGLDRVRLIAHDWGAWTGFGLCLREPARFSHFVALNMLHPWPRHWSLVSQAWRFWYTAVIEYPVLGRLALRRWPAFTRYLLVRGVADPKVWDRADLDEFVAASSQPGAARAGQALHWGFVVRDIPALATGRFRRQELAVPTLILAGADDVVISPRMLSGGHRQARDLRVEVIAGAGHQLADEMPGLVADRARLHLRSA
jgi:pimeloyl-ACP methyl ester carboxylesterase